MGVLLSWGGLFSKEPDHIRTAYTVESDRRAAHLTWVESDRATGERLVLCGDLSWRDLRGLDLRRADLRGVNFRSANLAGADLTEADVTGATFWDADLTDANLTGVLGLRAPSDGMAHPLGGANLSGATLPAEAAKFGALDNVAELCRSAGKLFVTLITADAFMQVIVAKTTDIQLLTGTGTATIPLLDADIPTAMLFWLGPLVLLILYVSFQLYLQRLWEMMAGLPAIFTDGMPLTQKSYPWLITDMVRNEFRMLKKQKQPLSSTQYWLFAVLVYLLVPLTLFPFWARYLCRHDWVVTGIQIGYAGLFLFTLLTFFRLARRTLRRSAQRLPPPPSAQQPPCSQPSSPKEPAQVRAVLIPNAVLGAGWSGVVLLLSLYTIQWGLPPVLYRLGASSVGPIKTMDPGDYHWIIVPRPLPVFAPGRWVPRVLDELGYHSFASVDEAELAVKPDGWLDTFKDDVAKVRQPARLRNVDLRYANLNRAFLVKADLRGAHLGSANLEYADLRSSDLRKADLPETDLYAAHLQFAHLDGGSLRGASLQEAWLEGTDLEAVDLTGAKMTGAFLAGAHLDGAILAGADLTGADLKNAVWDSKTIWPDGKTGPTDVFVKQHRHMIFKKDPESAAQHVPSPPSIEGGKAKAP